MGIYSSQILSFALVGAVCMAGEMHTPWDSILKRYVNEAHRVDYERLKREGLRELDGYVKALAEPWPAMNGTERKAALINAYNALTVWWMASKYPVKSVWKTPHPFTEARHTVDGKMVSLDGIETELRNGGDPRVHAVLVCAARSCPPLRREAYVAERLEQQLNGNAREWLANSVLNRFDAAARRAEVSNIFDWYRGDFDARPEKLEGFLAKHGPERAAFLRGGGGKISFLDYNWGLNDAGSVGEGYGGLTFYFDYFRNKWF